VVEAIADAVKKLFVEAKDDVVECQMVEVYGSPKDVDKVTSESQLMQDAWNKITTYLAENEIKKALEARLQQGMVV